MKDAELDVIELLSQYLHGRRVMPTVETARLPPGVAGSYNPGRQEIKLARGADISTLIHELTHAAQTAMEGQAIYDQPGGKFSKAFEKLFGLRGRYGEGAQESAARLAPQWMADEDKYRTSGRELQAHGLGEQFKGVGDLRWQAPSHVDPTMATEFMILLDLAIRESEAGPQGKWYRRAERQQAESAKDTEK